MAPSSTIATDTPSRCLEQHEDGMALTVEALNRLNLATASRPTTADFTSPVWTLAATETNLSRATAVVESYVRDPASFIAASGSRKLVAYQALVLQFDLCDADELPTSVTQCIVLLRTIHINLCDYLEAVKQRRPISSVHRYDSVKELRSAMISEQRFVKLKVAKQAMLRPFLISV